MSSTDGLNATGDLTGSSFQYAEVIGAASSAVASIQQAVNSVGSSTSGPDLSSLTGNAVDAVTSESLSGVSLAALGDLGGSIITAERLIATLPPYLGSGVDRSA